MPTSVETPTLAYDRSLNRDGIAVDQSEGYFRLITPRLGSWRALGKGWFGGMIAMGFFALVPLTMALRLPAGERIPAFVGASEYAVGLALIVAFAAIRLNQQFIFEITRDTFSLTRVDGTSRRRTWIYRRDAITSIHPGAIKGFLIVHVRGQDMIELSLSRDPKLAEQVADALNAAMKREMAAIDPSLPKGLISEPRIENPKTRKVLVGISVALGTIGVLMLFTQLAPLACFAWLAAAVPLGIAYGTQEKEYWMF